MKRVLVVEDDEDLAESLEMLLSELGHQVHIAVNGAQGVDEALRWRPDVVVADLGLPVLDGFELGRRLRASLPGVTLVGLSGHAEPEFQERALASGFDRYLRKPMELDVLLQALEARRREE